MTASPEGFLTRHHFLPAVVSISLAPILWKSRKERRNTSLGAQILEVGGFKRRTLFREIQDKIMMTRNIF